MRGFHQYITQRNAPKFRRHAAGTCGKIGNTVLVACGTPAARRWLPQALALPSFFATFFVEPKTRSGFALHYAIFTF